MSVEVENFENPDLECNKCGSTNWNKISTDDPPPSYPGGRSGSDVVRHQYKCSECDGPGRIFEEGGHLTLTANMRQ